MSAETTPCANNADAPLALHAVVCVNQIVAPTNKVVRKFGAQWVSSSPGAARHRDIQPHCLVYASRTCFTIRPRRSPFTLVSTDTTTTAVVGVRHGSEVWILAIPAAAPLRFEKNGVPSVVIPAKTLGSSSDMARMLLRAHPRRGTRPVGGTGAGSGGPDSIPATGGGGVRALGFEYSEVRYRCFLAILHNEQERIRNEKTS